jgi:hypothetical protein
LASGKAAEDVNPSVLDVKRARQLFLMNSYPPKCKAIPADIEMRDSVRGEKKGSRGAAAESPLFRLAGDAMASDVVALADRAAAAADADVGFKGVARGDDEAALLRMKEDLDVRISVDGTSRKPLIGGK